MKKKLFWAFIMIAMCILTSCKDKNTIAVVREKANDPSCGPKIEFSETTHDFGTINTKDGGFYVFHYSNIGDQPLIVSDVLTNCGCLSTQWSPEPLNPGQSDSISIQITTQQLGNLMKAVVIRSNAANEPVVTLRMTGKVVKE